MQWLVQVRHVRSSSLPVARDVRLGIVFYMRRESGYTCSSLLQRHLPKTSILISL
ncbi:hypothetical protein B0F90DRAFT_385998 [Multifurca ochricompacta]|uniref:Uncharacterized protein n=1 Tax=Multifurca ochricompacta TaxID=376703 RepID=A0AAD4LXD5_9AGAM|nr:hypothetical protein B0F90DRAFT_385998 [Multifurca ochricompacta]